MKVKVRNMNISPLTIIAKRLQKIVAAFLIVAMNWNGLAAVLSTGATFNDTEASSNNAFSAGVLDMVKTEGDWSAISLTPGETITRSVTISKVAGGLDFDYGVAASGVSGDLCAYLNIAASLNNEQAYNGLVSGLVVPANPYSGDPEIWDFAATLTSNDPALSGKSCNFEIVYRATQTGGGGFSDSETVSNTIGAGSSWQGSWTWNGSEQLILSSGSSLIIRPNGAGSQTGLTSSGGANYTAVDEINADDGTYVYDNTATEKSDLYSLGNASQTGKINWVKAHAVMKQAGDPISEGPRNAGAGDNLDGAGSASWTGPEHIINTSDSEYAEAGLWFLAPSSRYLKASQYGFDIPSNAMITGVTATINRKSNSSSWGVSVKDAHVYLLKNGTIIGNDNAKSDNWPTSLGTASYGNNLWGTTWLPSEINSNNFGVALSVRTDAISRTASVDYIKITVAYTLPGSGKTYIQTSNGTFAGSSNALTTSYVDYSTQYDTYPGTTDKWTWGQVNALQAGTVLQGPSRTTQVWAEVNYSTYLSSRTYESAPYDSNGITKWNNLTWTGDILPAGTTIELSARSSNNNSSNWSDWTPWSTASDISLGSLPESRFIQWRARLSTANVANTPTLTGVTISYRASLAGSSIKLNEFLPNPSSGSEWVELYNNGATAVDLNDWQIKNASGTASAAIGAGTVLQPNKWFVTNLPGDALGNTSGGVALYDPFGNKVDFYNYNLCDVGGNIPTPGATNDDNVVTQGTCDSAIPLDKSYARIPDGTGPWYDPIPTPGGTNELSEEEMAALNATTTEEIIEEPLPVDEPLLEQQLDEFFADIDSGEGVPVEEAPVEESSTTDGEAEMEPVTEEVGGTAEIEGSENEVVDASEAETEAETEQAASSETTTDTEEEVNEPETGQTGGAAENAGDDTTDGTDKIVETGEPSADTDEPIVEGQNQTTFGQMADILLAGNESGDSNATDETPAADAPAAGSEPVIAPAENAPADVPMAVPAAEGDSNGE